MASTHRDDPHGPLAVAVATIHAALDDLAHSSWIGASEAELGDALTGLTSAAARLSGAQLQVAAEADRAGVGSAVGASSVAAWWAHATRTTHRAARAAVKLAHATESDGPCSLVGAALADGLVLEEQARVIVKAVADLPTDLDPAIQELAEKALVDLAGEHDADALRVLGRGILAVVAPDVAEEAERRKIEGDERRAWEEIRFTMTDDGQGMTRGRFTIPTAQADLLRKILLAFLAKRRREDRRADNAAQAAHTDGTGIDGRQAADGEAETDCQSHRTTQRCREARVGPQAMGEAFVSLLESVPPGGLPAHGGVNPTIVATMTLEQLTGQGPDAHDPVLLDTGTKVSAGQARRWACSAGIIPAVLGTASVVLDMGRRARLYNARQRIALGLRDQGCTAVGCERPPSMCEAHHMEEWVRDHGPSDLATGRLLCRHHHRLIHDPAYDHRIEPDGSIAFVRRT